MNIKIVEARDVKPGDVVLMSKTIWEPVEPWEVIGAEAGIDGLMILKYSLSVGKLYLSYAPDKKMVVARETEGGERGK